MKLNEIIQESFQTISIGGILRSLNMDEKKIYDKIKTSGKLYKSDLDEFDQRIASQMVTKGLLKRRKNPQHKIYFTTKGRIKTFGKKLLDEIAPPDKEIESWINKNKDKFKEKYGKDFEKYLYGKAWNKFNGKKNLKETKNNLNNNFWKWFGNSKVIDKQGNPLVVIHRTKSDFNTFDITKSHLMNLQGKGFYFSTKDDLNMKTSFGNKIMKCYLSIQNPFQGYGIKYNKNILKKYISSEDLQKIFEGNNNDFFEGYELFFGLQMSRAERNIKGYDTIDTTAILKDLGFDGIYLSENNVWVAFEPNQIKSIDNNGEWNSNSNNIYESIFYKGEIYSDFDEEEKDIIVWKNPSASWLQNKLNENMSFRFVYNSKTNILYCWDAYIMTHIPVMEYLNIRGDIMGTLLQNCIEVWPYISKNDDLEEAIEITKQKFGKWLEQIYPDYDNIEWSANY